MTVRDRAAIPPAAINIGYNEFCRQDGGRFRPTAPLRSTARIGPSPPDPAGREAPREARFARQRSRACSHGRDLPPPLSYLRHRHSSRYPDRPLRVRQPGPTSERTPRVPRCPAQREEHRARGDLCYLLVPELPLGRAVRLESHQTPPERNAPDLSRRLDRDAHRGHLPADQRLRLLPHARPAPVLRTGHRR